MKVVLKPSILDEILTRIRDAESKGRKVDYILVTPEEMGEIAHQMRPDYLSCYNLKTITLTDRTDPSGPKRTFSSRYTLFGYPLYIVPHYFN